MKQELITDIELLQIVQDTVKEICSYYEYDFMFNNSKLIVYNYYHEFTYNSYEEFLRKWLPILSRDNHLLKYEVELIIDMYKFIKE